MAMSTIRCNGKILQLDQPLVMGILNVTPDSFYEGSIVNDQDSLIQNVSAMLSDGVALIDIGGQSTRPGSVRLTASEELERVLPAVKKIVKYFPEAILSIDTYHSMVAKAAIESGAAMINDVSAGEIDPAMIPLVAKLGVPYVAMHMQGTPDTMQVNPQYDDIVNDISGYFARKVSYIRDAGVIDLIIDPGFGFGKTVSHNFQLLAGLKDMTILGCPLLVGLSRKSFIQKTLDIDVTSALNGTTAIHMLALMNGASILRVHDVKAAVETIKIYQAYKNAAFRGGIV